MRALLLGTLCVTELAAVAAEVKPLQRLGPSELEARVRGDARSVLIQREGLHSVISYVESRPDLFPASRRAESQFMRREDKEAVWSAWQRFLDYLVALESTERYHASFHRLKSPGREDSFLIGYGAFLARYRAALDFISRAENNSDLDKILNEPVPEIGLPEDTYTKLKLEYLNVAIASRFAAREALLPTFRGDRQPALREAIRADAAQVWKTGRGRGEWLTAKNALKVLQHSAQTAWFPIQAGVAEWTGDTQVYRAGQSLVAPAQIRALLPKLAPGDILLERREWYLSNIGLPGFWSHAALYIGTPAERRAFFGDAATRAWMRQQGEASGDLEALLQRRHPAAYRQSLQPQEEGREVRVLEAISEGVSFTSLEHSTACDSLAVLRPRLTGSEKAQALMRAFRFAGRPYDFSFDFATDAELVCTELVYKAYEPANDFRGLQFPLIEMLGRKVMPANHLARQFDAQWGTREQQYDLVIFLDGQERQKKAVEAPVAAFQQSWKRPKWHVLRPAN